ncbi:hypothetical protein ACE1SV_48220 [Streptomyces sennicomposti]
MPPGADVAEPHQLAVDGEQSEEDGEVGAVPGVVPAAQVVFDPVAQRLLELIGRGVVFSGQRAVQCGEVEPVGGVGHGFGDEGGPFAGAGGGVSLLEVGPLEGRPLGVCGEQPVVVGVAEFLLDQRPDVGAEVEAAGAGQQRLGLGGAEEAGQRRALAGEVVADLGVVRDSAPRADVQHRFLSGGEVGVLLVAAAATLGEQHHQVHEGESETAHEDGFAGLQGGQVAVGGEVGRQVDQAVGAGVVSQLLLLPVVFGVEVAEGEDDEVGEERARAALQPHLLASVVRAADAEGAHRVVVHGDAGRQRGHGLVVHPAQIGPLEAAVGEGAPGDAGPLVQGGSLAHRSGHVDGVVGEHGDVLGVRVHPQQRRLGVAPDPAAARRMRVDQMDVELRTGVQLGGVGGDALDETGPPRPGPHDDECGFHRLLSDPRA